jgi:hypothetical protein
MALIAIGIKQIEGRGFGPKEFIELIGSAPLGTRFQMQGATFEITHGELIWANVPFDGS